MELKISYGDSRLSKRWVNKKITFEELCKRFDATRRTTETVSEYRKYTKDKRDSAKDVGGYILGHLKGDRRKKDTVKSRSGITLDADRAYGGFITLVEMLFPYRCAVYSTHSHTPEETRLRMVIPLAREVMPDEYAALSRLVANEIGMDYFDDSTYEPERLMYWPSTPSDGEYIFTAVDGDILDPNVYLSKLSDWRDCSLWPTSSRRSEVVRREIGRQQDPLGKDGTIGAFCRAYGIEDAITAFLSDVYELSPSAGRYDYIPADSSAGVVLYDGKWAYSHHATDPACGKLCNAFDLVRIHKFPDLDEKASFKAMSEFAVSLDAVKIQLDAERRKQAAIDFSEDGDDWRTLLKYKPRSSLLENRPSPCGREKNGTIYSFCHLANMPSHSSVWNLMLILNNDPDFANFGYNEMANRVQVTGKTPWARPPDNKF